MSDQREYGLWRDIRNPFHQYGLVLLFRIGYEGSPRCWPMRLRTEKPGRSFRKRRHLSGRVSRSLGISVYSYVPPAGSFVRSTIRSFDVILVQERTYFKITLTGRRYFIGLDGRIRTFDIPVPGRKLYPSELHLDSYLLFWLGWRDSNSHISRSKRVATARLGYIPTLLLTYLTSRILDIMIVTLENSCLTSS
jgi:hypothetical protein